MTTSLDKLNDSLDKHYDVFIASASFEDRCFSVLNSIKESVEFTHKLVSASIHHRQLIQKNLDIFVESGFHSFDISNTSQIKTVTNLVTEIHKVVKDKPDASFLIDLTTFTRQTILILMRLLRNGLSSKNKVKFLYSPAKEYSPGLSDERKWLTRGILEVNSVFGFSGIIRPSRPYHLIILMGFEVERASSLIAAYEPSKITVGYANKTDSMPEHYEINKLKFDELLSEFPNAESFEFSCKNVLVCEKEILKVVEKHKEHNVVISPMNNKISTVSSALAAFDNDEIQLAIPVPVIYNFEYSIPGTTCHLLDMPNFIKENIFS